MLKKHADFFRSLFFISDLLILSLAWVFSYGLRFYTALIRPPSLGIPSFPTYLEFLIPLLILWGFLSRKMQLYRPRRIYSFYKELFEVGKCLTLTLLASIAVTYFLKRFEFSRLAFLYFWIFSLVGLLSVRYSVRTTLKILRQKGYNKRYALIAGTGLLGLKTLEKLRLYPAFGIQVLGFLSRNEKEVGKRIQNIPVLGVFGDLNKILKEQEVDILFVALSINDYDCFESLIEKVNGHLTEIKVVPASYEFLRLRGGMDDLDGLPIVSLQGSPLYGWDRIIKRMFDLVIGSFLLIVMAPVMSFIALLIKLTSPGAVFYRQERVGMDGHSFQILKFRTMKVDAENETGPIWAKENDPRRTKIGAFLRKTSLDELPQLFNVLKGEMSLVGPRPERPIFVEEFRKRIPSYMLRHKIKAGMTGWAQVNGWRGNTSVEKRIEHDLYYIQNWSIGFDLKILFMTLWKGFFSKSAY